MPITRRTLLAACALAPAYPAFAQAFPARPIHLIVGFPAGGPNDILGRLIAQWLTQRLGQPVIVENRPGASSNIATEAVVRAPPDGYTLLLVGPANAINASLAGKLNFDFLRDITPIGGLTREALVLLVHPSVPATNVAALIAHANANRLKMASTGNGSSPHVSGLLFRMLANVDCDIVHYAGGGPALKAMIAGEAQFVFEPMSASIGPVRKGELRALAVTTATRSPALPDIPPLADAVPGYEASAATGLGAPAGTPAEVIARLNAEINAAFADPAMQARFADTGGSVLPGSPADFRALLAGETEKWRKVIKAAGIAP